MFGSDFKTMEQFIYIKGFKVLAKDAEQISEKVKVTGYKKKRAYDSKHKPTERIAKKMDDDSLYEMAAKKYELKLEIKREKQRLRRLSKKRAVHR